MKKKDDSVRRSIKFDDANFNLVMDVRVNDQWKRISAEEAREVARKSPEINSGPVSMGSDDITAFLNKK